MPVYLALQLIGCAAPPVAGRTGGLLPRLFHPCRSRRGRAVVFCHTCPDVAAGFPLGNAMLFCCPDFPLLCFAHRATDLISVFCKVTEIFPDVQIGRANSDTFDGEKCRSHSRIRIISVSFICFIYFQNLILTVFVQCCRFCPICRQPRPGFLPGVQREESTQRW